MLTIEASIHGIPLITTAKNTLNPDLISKLDNASSLNFSGLALKFCQILSYIFEKSFDM